MQRGKYYLERDVDDEDNDDEIIAHMCKTDAKGSIVLLIKFKRVVVIVPANVNVCL